MLFAAVIAFPLAFVVPPFAAPFVGAALGLVVAQIRWAIWRRRHPTGQCAVCRLGRDLIAASEKRRETAKWN